ncbi:MAG: radical SAM protein [Pseudomonadota bacterium]
MKLHDGLRLAPTVARSRVQGGPPYKLLLSLTDHCTHRCRACRTWTVTPGDELRPAEVGALLAGLPSLRWLDLTGGEIVARPDADALADAIAGQAGRLVFLHFATNGWEPVKVSSFARRLLAARGPRLVVTVSLDGDEALHDQMRGQPGAFGRAVDTVRALQALPRTDVYLGTTLTPDNAPHLERVAAALVRALPALAPSHWHVNLMTRSAHFFRNEGVPALPASEALAATRVLERLRGPPRDAFALVERAYLRALRGHLATGAAPAPCQALHASVMVGPTGTVYPCHLRNEPVGNVREAGLSLPRVLQAPPARTLRERITREGCAGCWTPCEAYHAMIAAPLRIAVKAWSAG